MSLPKKLTEKQMELIVLSGSPIGIFNIDFELTKEEKKHILNLEYNKDGYQNSPFISKGNFLFKNNKLKRIEKILFNYVNQYKNDILKIDNDLRVVHSWATMNDNTNHRQHAHRNSFISCAFYVENEGNNKLMFNVEKSILQKCHYLDYKIKEFNWFNCAAWTINIKKGDIVIFLSDLLHQSINEGKKTMIGANYFLTGEMGDEKNYTYLKI
jgi:hypothetical protein